MNKTILLLATILLFAACQDQQIKEAELQRPNIIYILADDLGYAELGSYGQQKIETPHIDALAANGMRFTQHYSGSPVCAPARCVLLTGKHSGHAQIRSNDELRERGDVRNFEAMSKDGIQYQSIGRLTEKRKQILIMNLLQKYKHCL